MKRFLIALIVLACGVAPGLLMAAEDYSTAEFVPGHLIVSFTENIGRHSLPDYVGNGEVVKMGVPSVDELLQRYQVTSVLRVVNDGILGKLDFPPDFYRSMLLLCSDKTDILKMMADFEQNSYVEWTQPDMMSRLYSIPNDALWTSQWDKRLMNCPVAWDYSTGSRDVIAMAVDGGTYWKHVDFHDNLWVNPGEDLNGDQVAYTDTSYPGDQADINDADDDGDGKIDDLIGWDFLRNVSGCAPGEDCDNQEDNDPTVTSLGDHGTHVIGLIGAVGNNGVGVAGVNWNIRIIPSRAGYVNTQGQGYVVTTAAVPCMLWGVGLGARIVNMSYGSSQSNSMERNAVSACWNQGAILVAAAGNDHVTPEHFPAAYPYVVSVGSVNDGDVMSSFSNYGSWVDIYSPGGGVMSTVVPGYANYEGTSMASPNAAGVFGLLWSLFPTMTNDELVTFVFSHCVDITGANPDYDPSYLGNGRIDAMLPLAAVRPNLSVTNTVLSGDNDSDGRLEPGESGHLVLDVHADAAWASAANVQVTVSADDPNLTISNGTFSLGTISPGSTLNNGSAPVTIAVTSSLAEAYWAVFTASITADGGNSWQRTFALRIGRPQTLIVGDDGTSSFHNFFANALVGEGFLYNNDLVLTSAGEITPTLLADYQIVVWVCGNENSGTISATDQANLTSWLNAGNKRLLVAGQGIDQDIAGTSFYGDVLHSQSSDSLGSRNLVGVDGDPISNGTTLLLLGGGCGGNGNVHPSKIRPINGGVAFYNYQAGGTGGVHFENDTYKVAYYAFAIEAACGNSGTAHHSVILRRTMEWFGGHQTPQDAPDKPVVSMPAGYALKANYPNPFNPTTTIGFELPGTTRVNITVFDMLGRQVAVLASGVMPAGSHQVQFDGSDLASGTYLVHMQADKFSATQRMVLMK